MGKMPFRNLKQLGSGLPWAVNFLFYGSICWIIAISELPSVTEPVFLMREQFLAGNEALFRIQDPGVPYSIFDPYRLKEGSVSFLMDMPYNPEQKFIEKLQAAQGRMAPLLLNPDPAEHTAFVFCSNDTLATARVQATGYQTTKILGDGKMIAEKKP